MRLTKYTHSCVRLEAGGRVLVIDPGVWSEPRALTGADAVLLTHEHADHADMLRLLGLGVPVYAPAGANLALPFTPVEVGEHRTVAGFPIRAVGGRHATIHGGLPDCANLGYLVDDAVYHPGDALHVPDGAVDTLLVPAQAAWLKTSEAIDFVRAVAPRRTFLIHDAQLNERGLSSVDGWLTRRTDAGYRYLVPGESADD